jgi:hypothetical protein
MTVWPLMPLRAELYTVHDSTAENVVGLVDRKLPWVIRHNGKYRTIVGSLRDRGGSRVRRARTEPCDGNSGSYAPVADVGWWPVSHTMRGNEAGHPPAGGLHYQRTLIAQREMFTTVSTLVNSH